MLSVDGDADAAVEDKTENYQNCSVLCYV